MGSTVILYVTLGYCVAIAAGIDPQPPSSNPWQSRNNSHPWQNSNWQTKQTGLGGSSQGTQTSSWPSLPGAVTQGATNSVPSTPAPWGPPNRNQQNQATRGNVQTSRVQNQNQQNHGQQRRPQSNQHQQQGSRNRPVIPDDELTTLSEKLFKEDVSDIASKITINYQKRTQSNSLTDLAPNPLLTVNPDALATPTIEKLVQLYDNYIADTSFVESVTAAEKQEESAFLDKVLDTSVMKTAMEFLADKGYVERNKRAYKDLLNLIWFTVYSRGGGIQGSSAFEHVFLGELKKDEVSGLHNWVYFANEEGNHHLDYMGYLKSLELGDKRFLLKTHYRWSNVLKHSGTLFVGTSPEFEMALYTVCFLTRPNNRCPVELGGKSFGIQTYNYNYRGKTYIGSAYPIF